MSFCNLGIYGMPDSALYLQEIVPLLNVLDVVISQNYSKVKQGSIALYGQKFGEAARPILTFDLSGGPFHQAKRVPKGSYGLVDSSQLSHLAIEEIQAFYRDWDDSQKQGAKKGGRRKGQCVPTDPDLRGDGCNQLHSGAFIRNQRLAFGLTAQRGRFLYSAYLDDNLDEQSRRTNLDVLYVITRTLQLMHPQDAELQKYDVTTDDFYNRHCDSLLQGVHDLIRHLDLPSLQRWSKWREDAIANDARGALFV